MKESPKEPLKKEINKIQDTSNFIRGIALEGGGVLGAGHIGALERMEELGMLKDIEYFAGSSVGSIISGAMACGATVEFMKDMIFSLDFNKFKDDSWNTLADISRFIRKYGWYKGNYLEKWYGDILKQLTGSADITMKEVLDKYGKYVIITVWNINTEITEYYTPESRPNLPLKIAVRRSASIPFFFKVAESVPGKNSDPEGSVEMLMDGGLLDNYPIHILDNYLPSTEVIGLKLMTKLELWEYSHGRKKNPGKPTSVIDAVSRVVNAMRSQALRIHVKEKDWARTIKINVDSLSSTDFDITYAEKKKLVENGRIAVDEFSVNYFESFDIGSFRPLENLATLELIPKESPKDS